MASGVMVAAPGASAQDQSDQSILARDLRSSDVGEVFAALTAATALPLVEWTPGLRQALVDAIVEEVKRPRGAKVLDDHHQLGALVHQAINIANAGDPVAIPALVIFPVAGRNINEALDALGEPAFAAVLDMVSSFSSEHQGLQLERRDDEWMYAHGLNALAYIVSQRGAEAYGREANARMRAAAVRTLASPLHELGIYLVVPSAMRLAFALGDPESLGAIAALTDADQIRAQGVTDPQQVSGKLEPIKSHCGSAFTWPS